MATKCAATTKLALPSLLRSVFRSEFSHDLRPRVHRHSSSAVHFQSRPFRSTARSCQIQINQSPDLITTSAPPQPPPTISPSSSSTTEQSTSGKSSQSASSKANAKKDAIDQSSPKAQRSDSNKLGKDKKLESRKNTPKKKSKPEPWQIQKEALDKKFPNGWNPPKKLSPDALEGIRHLHATAPERFTTAVLAEEFKVSPEAIRRILKSRWRPSEAEAEDRRKRWEKRHERIWSRMAELGLRPSTKASRPYSDVNTLYK